MLFARKPLAQLIDMPWHVKKTIVESAEVPVKLALRGTNSEFKGFVEKPSFDFSLVYFNFSATHQEKRITIGVHRGIKAKTIVFTKHLDGSVHRTTENFNETTKEEVIESSNYMAEAVSCLRDLFEIKGLKIKTLSFSMNCEDFGAIGKRLTEKDLFLRELAAGLASLPQKLKVKNFICSTLHAEDAHSVLALLDRKVLEKFKSRHSSKVTNRGLSMDFLLSIPDTSTTDLPVEHLATVFEHARRSPIFEKFFTEWSAEVDICWGFVGGTNWRWSNDGCVYTRVPTEDPDFVLLISIDPEASFNSVLFRRERVQPEEEL